jgi:hypothetical protein
MPQLVGRSVVAKLAWKPVLRESRQENDESKTVKEKHADQGISKMLGAFPTTMDRPMSGWHDAPGDSRHQH